MLIGVVVVAAVVAVFTGLYNNKQREKKTRSFELFKILSVPYEQYMVIPLVVVVVVVAFIITILKDDTALEYISCLVGTMLGNELNENYVR